MTRNGRKQFLWGTAIGKEFLWETEQLFYKQRIAGSWSFLALSRGTKSEYSSRRTAHRRNGQYMKITISAKWKEIVLMSCANFPVPIFLFSFSWAWMICGSLRRSAWSEGNCNGNIIYCAAHDIFMVKKSFVFEHLSKTTDSWSS